MKLMLFFSEQQIIVCYSKGDLYKKKEQSSITLIMSIKRIFFKIEF